MVNDASTDHTMDVLNAVSDPRLKVITCNSGGFVGAVRNQGIRASQGRYVAFLDDDDTWRPNKLERIAEITASDPGVGLICHDQAYFRYGKAAGRSYHGPTTDSYAGNLYDYMLLTGDIPSPSSTTVDREHLVRVEGFSEDLATAEDYDTWLRLSTVCRFRFVREVLGIGNYHSLSSTTNVEGHLRDNLTLLDLHFSNQEALGKSYPSSSIKRRYAFAYYGAARQYYRLGRAKASMAMFVRALLTWPFFWRIYAGAALSLLGLLSKKARTR